jgi:LPPG:FO 2-phospho-L-lactate transferase
MPARITMLGGGIGCSRLAVPLADIAELTLVINTADDLDRYGLRICPDIDTNLYALAGLRDQVRGWGVAGDTFRTMRRLRELGQDPWFNLGDLDLATHFARTELLAEGLTLTATTAELGRRFGVGPRILPMTDDEVHTVVTTADGDHRFQEWFVKMGATGPVEVVAYAGIEQASPGPGVLDAISDADVVVIGPSSPVASIEPILALAGVRDRLAARRSTVIAVTPIVDGVPIVDGGEAHRARARSHLMQARGLRHRSAAVAEFYADIAGVFVLDTADEAEAPSIEASDQQVVIADTLIASNGCALATWLTSSRCGDADTLTHVTATSGSGRG